MRIISKFHDYYDAAMRYGHDDTSYVRNTEFIGDVKELKTFIPPSFRIDKQTKFGNISLYPHTILFCGKIYHAIEASGFLSEHYDPISQHFYDVVGLNKFLGIYKTGLHDASRWAFRKRRSLLTSELRRVEEFLSKQGDHAATNVMIDRNLSILHYNKHGTNNEWGWYSNPSLRQFEFYKIMDPFIAYQELMMWVTGILPQKEMMTATVSDKDRLTQRGFNKWSFRKPPQK